MRPGISASPPRLPGERAAVDLWIARADRRGGRRNRDRRARAVDQHRRRRGHARWVAFTALVFGQLVRAYANRSLIHPLRGLPANGFLAIACLVGGLVQLAIPYVPPLAEAFRATPLDGLELALVALIEIVPAVVAETVRSVRATIWVA